MCRKFEKKGVASEEAIADNRRQRAPVRNMRQILKRDDIIHSRPMQLNETSVQLRRGDEALVGWKTDNDEQL